MSSWLLRKFKKLVVGTIRRALTAEDLMLVLMENLPGCITLCWVRSCSPGKTKSILTRPPPTAATDTWASEPDRREGRRSLSMMFGLLVSSRPRSSDTFTPSWRWRHLMGGASFSRISFPSEMNSELFEALWPVNVRSSWLWPVVRLIEQPSLLKTPSCEHEQWSKQSIWWMLVGLWCHVELTSSGLGRNNPFLVVYYTISPVLILFSLFHGSFSASLSCPVAFIIVF